MPRGRHRLCTVDARRVRRAIGAAIRQAREARGWSQLRLCAACAVSQATLSRWESGEGSLRVEDLYRVACALELGARDLWPVREAA